MCVVCETVKERDLDRASLRWCSPGFINIEDAHGGHHSSYISELREIVYEKRRNKCSTGRFGVTLDTLLRKKKPFKSNPLCSYIQTHLGCIDMQNPLHTAKAG